METHWKQTSLKENEERGRVFDTTQTIEQKETRETYWRQASLPVPKEHIILLKKIKLADKLAGESKKLEIKIDKEKEEVHFAGPQEQVIEAISEFSNQMKGIDVKELSLSPRVLKVLCSEEGIQKVNHELESNEVEAICFIDKDAKIVGTSAAHVDAAEKLVNELMLEKQVKVDAKSDHLLKSTDWIKICDEINAKSTVCVHGNVWNDTRVVGFKDEVSDVLEKLSAFLEDNYIKQEDYVCISDLMRKYIGEFRENNLRSIEDQLKEFYVSIKNGERPEHFEISGKREGLKRARKKLDHLTNDIALHAFDIEQPGLLKYLDTKEGRCLVKSVEKEQDCVIGFKENLCRESETESTASTGEEEMTIEEGNEYDDEINHDSDNNNDSVRTADDGKCDDNDEVDQNDASGCGLNDVTSAVDEGTTVGNDTSTLVTTHGHNISWKPGFIEQEKVFFYLRINL